MAKKKPFVPSSKEKRLQRCTDIFAMQVGGLVKRLEVTSAKPVVGVSGGMDSTLALLVGCHGTEEVKKTKYRSCGHYHAGFWYHKQNL